MRRGIGLVAGGLGVAVVGGLIYTVLDSAGQSIFRGLTQGAAGLSAPASPPTAGDLLAPDSPLGAILRGDGPVATHLREGDGPLARRVQERLGAFEEADRRALSEAVAALGPALQTIDLEDPTGRDLHILFTVLKGGRPEQRQAAARALATLGDPLYLRPILTASQGAETPLEYCLAALGVLAKLEAPKARALTGEVLADPQQAMHEDCRGALEAEQDRWDEEGGAAGEPPPI